MMIFIQELNWSEPEIIDNPFLDELITKRNEIFSSKNDIDFRIADEKKINIKVKPKLKSIPYTSTTLKQNTNVPSAIQEFQLNLYKTKNTNNEIFINADKCYVDNKLLYLKLNNQCLKILNNNNIKYIIQNNNLFVESTYLYKYNKLFNLSKNVIYFLDNQLYILTYITYKKINNALLVQLKNQLYTEKFNIYKWSNFEDTLHKLNNLLTKFNFDINIILNNAIINHYKH